MTIRGMLWVAALAGCVGTGCADSPRGGNGSYGAGGDDGGIIPGEITLSVDGAVEAEVGPVAPLEGQGHVVLQIHLANGLSESIPVSPLYFYARGDDGLERLASPLTALRAEGCPDALLSAEAETLCELVFEIPETVLLEELSYQTADDISEYAPIPPVTPCDRCDDRCVELSSDRANCGACGRTVPSDGFCVGGEVTCEQAGEQACSSADGSLSCLVPNTADHCGACQQACQHQQFTGECEQGGCIYRIASFVPLFDCNFECQNLGLICERSELCGNIGSCTELPPSGCGMTCVCVVA